MTSWTASSFVADLKRITRNKRRAADVLNSTESYYAELTRQLHQSAKDWFTEKQFPIHAELSKEDTDILARRFAAPVVLVVGGSRCSSVALLLKRLMGRPIFSESTDCPDSVAGKSCQIRDVRVQYGPSNRATYSNGQRYKMLRKFLILYLCFVVSNVKLGLRPPNHLLI